MIVSATRAFILSNQDSAPSRHPVPRGLWVVGSKLAIISREKGMLGSHPRSLITGSTGMGSGFERVPDGLPDRVEVLELEDPGFLDPYDRSVSENDRTSTPKSESISTSFSKSESEI